MLLSALVLLACSGDPPPPHDGTPTAETGPSTVPTEPDLQAFRQRLEADGFIVQEGALGWVDLEACCDWESCWKRTPTTDYGIYHLPLAPGEDPEGRVTNEDGLQFSWRLRPDEAVVLVGTTPPPAAYYSFRTYQHETWYEALGVRGISFASLGDSLNQLEIATDGGPFDANTVLISTPDRATDARVRAAAMAAGFPAGILNTEVLPADHLHLGLGEHDDGLRMNLRLSAVADPARREAYLADPGATVWRVTPATSDGPLDPFPAPAFRPAGSPGTEDELAPALAELREAILAAHADHPFLEAELNLREPDPTEDCWPGCNRDATYANTPAFDFPEVDDAFLVVYGVNHVATGKAAYATAILFGVDNDDPGGVLDATMMPGSARRYLPDHPDADRLYAWRFARDCQGEAYCSEVPATCPGVGPSELAAVHYRAYLDPATGTHPLASELLEGTALLFAAPP